MLPALGRDETLRSIGRYEIRRELGRGTMGVVYEAWDPDLGRTIALKTVGAFSLSKGERRKYERRFQAEARAAARLSHPGIVVVHDVGRDAKSGLLFMALEYLEGETLAERLASGRRLEWREALRIVGRVAEALHHAHAQGVVHRDVKPANVMVLRSGEPKILDFGIARVDAGHLTQPGELFGTPLYMSPEQAEGRPVDARSDLFSLGTIAYALLTGESPFAGPSVVAILARVAHRSARPPSELVPGLPRDVDDVLARAMAKSPADRYPDGRTMAEDIDDVLAGRPPRHREGWTPTPSGEQTIASVRPGGDEELPALDLVEGRAVRPPRRRWRRRLAGLALLAAVVAAGHHFFVHPEDVAYWRRIGREARGLWSELTTLARVEPPATPSPLPEATASPAAPSSPLPMELEPTPPGEGLAEGSALPASPEPEPLDAAAVPAEAGPSENAVPAPAVVEPAPTPTPEAEPTATPAASNPTPTPTPTVKAAPKTAPKTAPRKPPPSAFLSIGFEHHLENGTLEVWVDGKRVVKEALDSQVTRKLLLLDLRQGSVQQTLSLSPGRHEVRVRLRSGDDVKSARVSATFRAGATRRLEVSAPRLRGGLTLKWK
jgi:hypothetical protein